MLISVLLGVIACAKPAPDQHPPPPPPVSPPAPARTPDPPPAGPDTALQTGFDQLARAVPATVGIAFAAVGTSTVTTFGSWPAGVAWSTIKVPLAIAALRADPAGADALVVRAITQSDNDAAEQLWSQLGQPEQAARRVQAVLAEAGDTTTVVQSQRVRPPFTAFGQTQWPLDRQAQFAAQLPCLADATRVIELMHNVVNGHWGLADYGAATKGGWGPGVDGRYLVRQFAVLSTPAGEVGVALAAQPDDGTFDSGVGALNRLAAWLDQHRSELPGGHCPA